MAAHRDDAGNARPSETETRVPTGTFFTGEFELTIDDKGRLLIPSVVRNELDDERDGKSLMIVIGQNGKHWFYPENYFKEQVAPRTNDVVRDRDTLDYMMLVYSSARRVTPDKQGRLVLPDDRSFDRDGLGAKVCLIGMQNHLQLWPAEEWDQHKARLHKQAELLAERYFNTQQAKAAPVEA